MGGLDGWDGIGYLRVGANNKMFDVHLEVLLPVRSILLVRAETPLVKKVLKLGDESFKAENAEMGGFPWDHC